MVFQHGSTPHLSVSEHNWYLGSRAGLQLFVIARPIAAYWRLRSALSMQAGDAILAISSFCWLVSFVILGAPPEEPGLRPSVLGSLGEVLDGVSCHKRL